MSELTREMGNRPTIKHQLLATASAVSLIGTALLSQALADEDLDRPTVWIELGGQLERVDGSQQSFAPHFTDQFKSDNFLQPDRVQRVPRYSNGIEGAINIEPEGSAWTFGASIRYGRSNTTRSSHNQVATPPALHGIISVPALGIYRYVTSYAAAVRFADAQFRSDERHLVLDFKAGRDVGLGGAGKALNFNAGVRVAQFTSNSHTNITANPGGVVPYKYATQLVGYPANIRAPNLPNETWDIYHASASISRSFKGLGPSLSFDGTIPLVGRLETVLVNADFGANGALLFGRQKADIHYRVDDERPILPHSGNFKPLTAYYHHSFDHVRSRSVIVPNIGGFAGLSFNYSNAKIKLGYRADLFFGAMDGGMDTRKTYDRNFFGPYATVSIGLGG